MSDSQITITLDPLRISPVLIDARPVMTESYRCDFAISEVAYNATVGMTEWWRQVDALLEQGKTVRLAIVEG